MAGRPPKFDQKMIRQAEKFIALGVTEAVMADFFDVDVATFRRWKHKYPEFRAVIDKKRLVQDAEAANSLLKLAKGTKIRATKIFYDADKAARAELTYHAERQHLEQQLNELDPASVEYGNTLAKLQGLKPPTDEDGIVRAHYVEHLPPNLGALVFYLKNRQPDLWKDKREITGNLGTEVKHVIEWTQAEGCEPLLTDEQIAELNANEDAERTDPEA